MGVEKERERTKEGEDGVMKKEKESGRGNAEVFGFAGTASAHCSESESCNKLHFQGVFLLK